MRGKGRNGWCPLIVQPGTPAAISRSARSNTSTGCPPEIRCFRSMMIDGTEAIYEFPLVDKDPLPRWSHGNATLIGDAAHPLYPIGSNGSAQAILDARYLADKLQEVQVKGLKSIELALKEYEADRLPTTTGIILKNRLNGPEQVMQLAHERAPDGFKHIHDAVPESELQEISLRYKRAAGFDPKALK